MYLSPEKLMVNIIKLYFRYFRCFCLRKKTSYTLIFHQAEEGGYWVEAPALPGCYSQGESIEETIKNIREAIEAHIEALKEEGQEIPEEGEFVKGEIKVALVR